MLIALVALAFFFLRRRSANVRRGPGPGGVRGMRISPPKGGSGTTGFAALAQNSDGFETWPVSGGAAQGDPKPTPWRPNQSQTPYMAATPASRGTTLLPPIATGPPMPFQSEVSPVADDPAAAGPTTALSASGSVSSYSHATPSSSGGESQPQQHPYLFVQQPQPQHQQPQLFSYPTAYMVRGSERQVQTADDQVPLTGQADEFYPQGYHGALGRIGEEDEDEEAAAAAAAAAAYQGHPAGTGGNDAQGGAAAGLGRPLWQQNRRQSRNLVWM